MSLAVEDDTLESDIPPERPALWRRVDWSALITFAGLAGLAFEATKQPVLASFVFCLKFGLPDLMCAWWLLRRDTDSRRKRAAVFGLMAVSCWRIVGAAVIAATILLPLALTVMGMVQGQAGIRRLLAPAFSAVVIALLGSAIASASSIVALVYARLMGVRLWLDRTIRDSRVSGEWPPAYGTINSVRILVSATQVWLVIFVPTTASILGRIVLQRPPNQRLLLTAFLASLLLSVWLERIARPIIATRPKQCWGEAEEEIEEVEEPEIGEAALEAT